MNFPPEMTEEERMEAFSKRYVDAARVLSLESGRYAVFTMARGDCIAICGPEALAGWVIHACALSAQAWEIARKEELAERGSGPAVPIAKTAEELGL